MGWSGLLNKESQIARFKKTFAQNRLASTYLFVGLPGIGKRLFALRLAQALLCENRNSDLEPISKGVRPSPARTRKVDNSRLAFKGPDPFGDRLLEACGTCSACHQVLSLNHPDLILISKPKDRAFIPVELFIGDKEHRRQQGLIHDIGLKPYSGGRKIAIIDDADFLNQEGANSLLKTLEEPPPMSVLILIGTSQQQQLPTVLSRSQVIRFDPLPSEQVLFLLQQDADLATDVPLDQLAAAAEGSMEYAYRLADSELFEFREQLLTQLASDEPGDDDFAKQLTSFVEAAGTEGALKRERLNFVGDLAINFLKRCYQELSGLERLEPVDRVLQSAVQRRVEQWETTDSNRACKICSQVVERTIELQEQVWMNVSTANIVDAWVIDVGRIFRGKLVGC